MRERVADQVVIQSSFELVPRLGHRLLGGHYTFVCKRFSLTNYISYCDGFGILLLGFMLSVELKNGDLPDCTVLRLKIFKMNYDMRF